MDALQKTGLISNILYATDFSAAAENALPFVRQIAHGQQSTLHVVHVAGSDTQLAGSRGVLFPTRQQIEQKLARRLSGIAHEVSFLSGRVWQQLSEFISSKRINLLVFTSQGQTNAENRSVGSVAKEIVRSAECPLLIVGPAVLTEADENVSFDRILFATDFTAESLAAVPYVVAIAQRYAAQPILLHVMGDGGDEQSMLYALRQLIPLGTDLNHRPKCEVKEGNPSRKIVETAEQSCADLIILGANITHDPKSSFEDTFISYILAKAKCPVFVVKR